MFFVIQLKGGPLIKKTEHGDVQVGVISFTDICGHRTVPDVYARLSKGINWIREWMEKTDPSETPTLYPTLYPTSNPTNKPILPTIAPTNIHHSKSSKKRRRGKTGKGNKRSKLGKTEMITEDESMSLTQHR